MMEGSTRSQTLDVRHRRGFIATFAVASDPDDMPSARLRTGSTIGPGN